MPFAFSDHFGNRKLNSGIDPSQTTIPLDALPTGFVDDVEAAARPRFPVRIGGDTRASHERVIVTGIADEANNEIEVERGVEYGAESHNAGTRVAHAFPAQAAQETVAAPLDRSSLAAENQILRAAIRKLDERVTALENA
jgi:hypothetical protein